jgi:hypothetical protein
MMAAGRTIPPRDSWIELPPGASVTIDAKVGREWKAGVARCRSIRGNVLARCFEIEYVLDQVIGETLIPESEENADRRDLLDELFLKGPGVTFRSKIDTLGKLRGRVPKLEALLPADTVARLNFVRELRNDFAHYPVTFTPVGEPPNQRLQPVLVSRRGRFTLDDAFVTEQATKLDAVFTDLEAAFKNLKPDGAKDVGGAQ